jgi:S-DNA-T family DNA segregation ATPase FtsK/SpoIIIE
MQMLDSRAGGTSDFGQQGGYAAPQTNQNQNQKFQQPQQQQQFNQPAPVAQQNFQAPPQMQQPFNQPMEAPVQQPSLQPPPVFNDTPPLQAKKPVSPSVTDDFDDDIPF